MEKNVWGVLIQKPLGTQVTERRPHRQPRKTKMRLSVYKNIGILGSRKVWWGRVRGGEFTIGKNQVVNTKFSIY